MVADTAAASIDATASYPLLSSAGLVLGAVGFGWPSAQQFGSHQVRTLDLVANLAAQALERAVLTQREHERASTRERADAQLLQDAFLPRSLPTTDTLDVAAVYLPASDAAMGGDWYDVFPVTGGTCLVIGDVAGHGVQPAAVMGQLRNTVRAYATEDPSPATVLTRLNRMMCRLQPGEYATAIVAVWDEERGTLLRSNAGHPPVLRCRPGEFEFLTPPPGGRLLGRLARLGLPGTAEGAAPRHHHALLHRRARGEARRGAPRRHERVSRVRRESGRPGPSGDL